MADPVNLSPTFNEDGLFTNAPEGWIRTPQHFEKVQQSEGPPKASPASTFGCMSTPDTFDMSNSGHGSSSDGYISTGDTQSSYLGPASFATTLHAPSVEHSGGIGPDSGHSRRSPLQETHGFFGSPERGRNRRKKHVVGPMGYCCPECARECTGEANLR